MRDSLVDKASVDRLLLVVGALRSGLIDALATAGPAPVAHVAGTAGADERASRIVLEALADENLVERTSDGGGVALYSLTSAGRAHLVDEGPLLERAGLIHQVNKLRGWLELCEVIRTGKPAPRNSEPGRFDTMVSAMGERDPEILDEIVDQCFAYAGNIHTMVDIGGAVGHLARLFSRRGVKATLFDREETLPVARRFLGDEAAGITMVGGDYTASLPAGPFDLVYFGNVYHIYDRDTNARVTREAYAITAESGTIAIQGYVWGLSERAAMFAVNMLRSAENGQVWAEPDYREWLEDAGFSNIEVKHIRAAGSELILARRVGR